jgi:L-2-hydroxyglutarate oxidase LhgO
MEVEAVVIGAGVVGLAATRRLAELGREVVVLEQENAIGTHGSSRNSEVIHGGMYYVGAQKLTSQLRPRHCERSEAIQEPRSSAHGLLRRKGSSQ